MVAVALHKLAFSADWADLSYPFLQGGPAAMDPDTQSVQADPKVSRD
jgi:hypothetical protein